MGTSKLSLESTKSHHLFEDLLTTYYIPMEMWYTRTIIDKVRLCFAVQAAYDEL